MKRVRSAEDDERKARARFIDQPGQRIDVTPPEVKARQAEGWAALEATLTPEQRLLMELNTTGEQLTEGEEEFLLGVLRGELNGVPDRFTGNAIVNVSPNTPEQQKAIDEINAELEARGEATRREG